MIVVALFLTKYAVPRQIKPGILKLTTRRGQSNERTVFIFVNCEENGCYRIVSLGHLSFDCRSYCGLCRRMQGVGWKKIDTVFDNQPTFGDNPSARSRRQPSNRQGDWWIGGAEDQSCKHMEAEKLQRDIIPREPCPIIYHCTSGKVYMIQPFRRKKKTCFFVC